MTTLLRIRDSQAWEAYTIVCHSILELCGHEHDTEEEADECAECMYEARTVEPTWAGVHQICEPIPGIEPIYD